MASKPQQRWSGQTEQTVSASSAAVGELTTSFERLWKVLEYSSAYLALIAMAEVLIVMWLLSLSMSLAPLVARFITFAIYANDRLIDIETDGESNPGRTTFVRRHEEPLSTLAAIAYGLGVALSLLGGPVAFGLAVLPGVAWIVYACNWVPSSSATITRLKDVLFVNSALVAAAWSVPIVVVPIAFADASFTPAAGVLILYFFIGTFINVEIANAGDIESDTASGVMTMPVAFGVVRTRQLLFLLTTLILVVLGYAVVSEYLTLATALILTLGLLSLGSVIALLGRVDNNSLLTVAAECTRLPVFAVLILPSLVG